MSSDPNSAAAVIRRWFEEVWNQGRAETIDELFPEHATMWGVGRPEHLVVAPQRVERLGT